MSTPSLYKEVDLALWADDTIVVYDGECPFCSRFAQWQRLKETVGPVKLMNARDGGELINRLTAAGYDLDEGMVLLWRNQIFHGEDCINRLALLSSRSTLFNALTASVFRSPALSRLLYPVLRAGRNLTLRLLGRQKLAATIDQA